MHHGIAPVALFALVLAVVPLSAAAKDYSLLSPNKAIEVKIAVGPATTYAVTFQGQPVVLPSAVSMALDAGRILGRDAKVRKVTRRGVNDLLLPVVTQKAAKVPDVFNEAHPRFRRELCLDLPCL